MPLNWVRLDFFYVTFGSFKTKFGTLQKHEIVNIKHKCRCVNYPGRIVSLSGPVAQRSNLGLKTNTKCRT